MLNEETLLVLPFKLFEEEDEVILEFEGLRRIRGFVILDDDDSPWKVLELASCSAEALSSMSCLN